MLNIALLGFGTIGSGCADVINENREIIEKRIGCPINIKYILDLRDFPDSPYANLIVHDYDVIVNDPEVDIIVEMMGGSHPAYEFTKAAFEAKKSVVTSNKECVANFGDELLALANKNGCRYLFEASVGGGIPVIRPIMNDLAPVRIKSISGILNGTTNYILTKMASEGVPFDEVLADAQKKGYAERNPAADVEGKDAARKIVILAALASGIIINADDIYCEGITKVSDYDMKLAESFGCTVKLIGRFERRDDGKLFCMVSPRFVPSDNPLYTVNDVFNGILIDTDMHGEVMFYGKGAGKLPTAGAVVADIVDIAVNTTKVKALEWKRCDESDIASVDAHACRRAVTYNGSIDNVDIVGKYFDMTACVFNEGKISFITKDISESDFNAAVEKCPLELYSAYRML